MNRLEDDSTDDNQEDLNVYELSGAQKRRFGCEIVDGQNTTRKIHRTHNLNRRTIQKYAHVIRVGGTLYERGGRPRIIDQVGLSKVANYWSRHPELVDNEIKVLIDLEREDTHRRRFAMDAGDEVCLGRLHRITYFRYLKELRVMAGLCALASP